MSSKRRRVLRQARAMDLARIGNGIPFTTARHELTHMMID
jgi:hypothetical protein